MANKRRCKQSRGESSHPPRQSPAKPTQGTPKRQTRSQRRTRQQSSTESRPQLSVAMSPQAAIDDANSALHALANAADESFHGGVQDEQQVANFAQQHIRNHLLPPQTKSLSPSQRFSPSQNFLPAPANRTAYAHIGGPPAAYGYSTGAYLQEADQAAYTASEEHIRMLQENGLRVPTATRLPPLDIARRILVDSNTARAYIDHPRWRPIPKSHGVPQTEEDRLAYVKKIYDALVDIDNVFDDVLFPIDKVRFEAGHGVWGSDPACIEAVAHEVVEICMALHNRGATGFALGRLPALRQVHDADRKFTFPQRIHFMALLLRHFKFHANHVMQSGLTMQYAARIWSTLSELPAFLARWNQLSPEMRRSHLHVAPYEDVPAKVMTREESDQFMREAMQEHNEKMRHMALYQQQRQQEMMNQQVQQVWTTKGMKRAIEQVQGRAADMANKRRHVEMPSGQLVPAQQQPDAGFHEEPALDEDAIAMEYEKEKADAQVLFEDGSASLQNGGDPQANLDDTFDAGNSDCKGDGKSPDQSQNQNQAEGNDGEALGEAKWQ